jgi:hypothetical protein
VTEALTIGSIGLKAVLCLLLVLAGFILAEEPTASGAAEPQLEERRSLEADFVASGIFRSGSLIVPAWKRLSFEGHCLGETGTNVGFTGASWDFEWKDLQLIPGFGVAFGDSQFATSAAISFRWDCERKWLVTQGLLIQCLRSTQVPRESEAGEPTSEPNAYFRPTISDGDHVSARWRRITIGGAWEHIYYREGDEWKGGGRLAVRVLPRMSLALYVLGPGHAEWRGGIMLHGPEED